jgi:hypothetical protein
MTILVWLDRARGGSVHEVVGPSIYRSDAVEVGGDRVIYNIA